MFLEIPSQYAENTHCLQLPPASPQSRAIPGETMIALVIQVHVVQIFATHGLESEIPCPNNTKRTSWVLVSRGKGRFVDELHISNVGPNLTSAFLLSEQEFSKEREPYLAKSKNSSQEIGAVSNASSRKVHADLVSFSPDPVHYTQRTILPQIVPSTSTPSLRTDSLQEENRARSEDKPSSAHLSTLLVNIQMKKNLRDDDKIPQKVHYHSNWKRNQDAVYWVKLSTAKDQGLRFWQTNRVQ